MPHRREPLKTEEPPWPAARHWGMGQGRRAEDSTEAGNERAVCSTREGRKSGPGAWVKLSALLEAKPWEAPGADPALRTVLTAFLEADTESVDGAVAFLASGEALLLLVEADGPLVRRNVTIDEALLYIAAATESA